MKLKTALYGGIYFTDGSLDIAKVEGKRLTQRCVSLFSYLVEEEI